MAAAADAELGTVDELDAAAALCEDFLTTDVLAARLTSPRASRQRPAVPLEQELRSIAAWSDTDIVERRDGFGTLLWDVPSESLSTLEGAVEIGDVSSSRRVILQRVGGEIRYWLCLDRDAPVHSGNIEVGTVATRQDAIELCRECLQDDVPLARLRASRVRHLQAGTA